MKKLFVHNLPKHTDDHKMRKYFSKFGEIEKTYVVKQESPQSSKRPFGFVFYKSLTDAVKVQSFKNHYMCGQRIYIKSNISKSQYGLKLYKQKECQKRKYNSTTATATEQENTSID